MSKERREIWAERVEGWVRSGRTSAEYAAELGVNARTLVYWKWRLGKEARESGERARPSARAAIEPLKLVELTSPVLGTSASRIEIALGDGVVVRVPDGFETETLRRVLDVVEGRR